MSRSLSPTLCLAAALFTTLAEAQIPSGATDQSLETNAAKSPAAFVYVTRPTHIDGFSAAADGKLTPVPGSPFSGAVAGISVSKDYLFGFEGAEQNDVVSYSIAANGSLTLAKTTNVNKPPDNCGLGNLQIDTIGQTLYVDPQQCYPGTHQQVEAFKVESDGSLGYLGESAQKGNWTSLTVLGNDKFAYAVGCYFPGASDLAAGSEVSYKRESNGLLEVLNASFPLPKVTTSGDYACPTALAADTDNHLAMTWAVCNTSGQYCYDEVVLAGYTADSNGNLATTTTEENAVPTQTYGAFAMSISPSGKLLAQAAFGFQVFHFDGGTIKPYSELLLQNREIRELGWDKQNHLYVLAEGYGLYVYTVTPTSIQEAPGSPYLIPEAAEVIVRDE